MTVITLLTDFGHNDGYVAMLKGVILTLTAGRLPSPPTIIDITHMIPPQDVHRAQFEWARSYAYFPPRSIHLAIVDPGVGSCRRPIAVATPAGDFIGPDNGLISGILQRETVTAAVVLDRPEYWRTPHPSSTFHGRDIFAPVAAHRANGIPLIQLGTAIDPASLIQCSVARPQSINATTWVGAIQAIDHFGNLITNLPGDWVLPPSPLPPSPLPPSPLPPSWSLTIAADRILSQQTYADAAPGTPIALVGSDGWIEIAIVNGNAANYFSGQVGDCVRLELPVPTAQMSPTIRAD
jgi:S-adenosyl-L-methionine hydrolase (adenosine-forming)